jgi:hypothetical protein
MGLLWCFSPALFRVHRTRRFRVIEIKLRSPRSLWFVVALASELWLEMDFLPTVPIDLAGLRPL